MKRERTIKDVGRFTNISWVPGEFEGQNLVRKLHNNFAVLGPDKPDDIGIRVIEIPPHGEIPIHDHDTDEFSSWIFCTQGFGEHVVEIDGETHKHPVIQGSGSVSTQKMLAHTGGLKYRHEFKAGAQGMTLINIYRVSEISDERLKEIQAGS